MRSFPLHGPYAHTMEIDQAIITVGDGSLCSCLTCLAWPRCEVWAAVQVPATSATDPPTQLLLKRIELLQQLHRNAEEHFAEREDAHLGYIAELEYQLTATQAQLEKVKHCDSDTMQLRSHAHNNTALLHLSASQASWTGLQETESVVEQHSDLQQQIRELRSQSDMQASQLSVKTKELQAEKARQQDATAIQQLQKDYRDLQQKHDSAKVTAATGELLH